MVREDVPSTQDLARRDAAPSRPAVVIAHRQTEGRGRSGAGWETAPRAVAVSVGFMPRWEMATWGRIPLVAAVAARRVLGSQIRLKWPNDLLAVDGKVGGILVEGSGGSGGVVVAGMGLNLWWPDPPDGAGALYAAEPSPETGPELGKAWAGGLLQMLDADPEDWPRDEYVAACETVGEAISWEPAGSGRAVGIAADGGLIVEREDGTRSVLRSGEVRHVRGA